MFGRPRQRTKTVASVRILVLNFRTAQFQEKSGVSIRLDFWLSCDDAGHICRARLLTSELRERVRRRVGDARAMEHEKCRADDGKDQWRKTPAQCC